MWGGALSQKGGHAVLEAFYSVDSGWVICLSFVKSIVSTRGEIVKERVKLVRRD